MKKIVLLSIGIVFLLSGCSLKEVEKRAIDYRLSPDIKEYVPKRQSSVTLKIKTVSGGDLANTRAIFYTKEGLMLPYKYARWSETPSKRLQQTLAETLSKQDIFKGVVDSHSYALGDILLEGRILDFEQVYEKEDDSYVHVRLRVNLVKRKEAQLVASKLFEAKITVKDKDTQKSVDAFNEAVEKILKEISEWVYEQTKY